MQSQSKKIKINKTLPNLTNEVSFCPHQERKILFFFLACLCFIYKEPQYPISLSIKKTFSLRQYASIYDFLRRARIELGGICMNLYIFRDILPHPLVSNNIPRVGGGGSGRARRASQSASGTANAEKNDK